MISSVNKPIALFITKRPSFAAVSVASQYEVGRDADVRDQLTLYVTGSACSRYFSLVHVALWTVARAVNKA